MTKRKTSKPTAPTLTEILQQAIRDDGRTRYAIAKAAGLTPIMVGRFESGERDITTATASKLMVALGLTVTRAHTKE